MNTQPQAALEAVDVSAGYGGRTVLTDIHCSIARGERTGLIGPNGAGKTTLLRVLSGALSADRGRVLLEGHELARLHPREVARVQAFVPQSLHVPVAFTVRELVAMGRMPYVSGWSALRPHDHEVIRNAMNSADVVDLADRPVGELSAGELQRSVIAMALAQEPRVLLLDEPTAHLDIQHAWDVMELVRDLNRRTGLTVVFSSHDLNLAAEFCDRLLLLEQGRIAVCGAPADVLKADTLSRVYRHPLDVLELTADRRRFVIPQRK